MRKKKGVSRKELVKLERAKEKERKEAADSYMHMIMTMFETADEDGSGDLDK